MTTAPARSAISVSLLVDGDAPTCRDSARRLRDLGLEVDAASRALHRQHDLLPGRFEGLAGTAYRDRASRLGVAADAFAARCTALGTALDRLAGSLERSAKLLAEARELAAPHGLVHGDELVRPGGTIIAKGSPFDELAQRAWEQASAKVTEARMYEQVAQGAWVESLRAYAVPFGSLVTPPPAWELPPRGQVEPTPGPSEHRPRRPGESPHLPQHHSGGPRGGLGPEPGGPQPGGATSGSGPGHHPAGPGGEPGRHASEPPARFRLVEVTPEEPVCGEPLGTSELPPGFGLPPIVPIPATPLTPPIPLPGECGPLPPDQGGNPPIHPDQGAM